MEIHIIAASAVGTLTGHDGCLHDRPRGPPVGSTAGVPLATAVNVDQFVKRLLSPSKS